MTNTTTTTNPPAAAKRETIRLVVHACVNTDVAHGSPNDLARTVYAPLVGTPWNMAMAKFLVVLAELPPTTKNRLRSAIVIGMRVGIARLPEGERDEARAKMQATIKELFPEAEATEDSAKAPAAPQE